MSDDGGLWARLDLITDELLGLYPVHAALLAAELDRKATVAEQLIQGGTSVSSADRAAQFDAVSLTRDVWVSQWRIRALEEERDHLRFTIKHRLGTR